MCQYYASGSIVMIFLLIHIESRKKDVVQIRKKHPDKIPVSVADYVI